MIMRNCEMQNYQLPSHLHGIEGGCIGYKDSGYLHV